jgi:adenylate cyclase
MYRLRFTDSHGEHTHHLDPGLTTIGRLSTCQLTVADPSVSRQHASITIADRRAALVDTGSRFGTFVNGVRVTQPVTLASGDEIRLGEVKIDVEQHVLEQDLLSDDVDVSEGPGTICRPMPASSTAGGGGDSHIVRLLADIGRTLLGSRPLSDILSQVVDMAFAVVPADRAFLMLRDSPDEALAARVLRHRDGGTPDHPTLSRLVVRRVMDERVAMLAADAPRDPSLGRSDSVVRFNIRSFMCAPLWSRDVVVGVLYVDSPERQRFTPADLEAFTALANAAAVAIEQARLAGQLVEEQRRRERLQRYHSPAVVNRILRATDDDAGAFDAQERDVTVLFCDLVGFTAMCEQLAPVQSAGLLNGFLTEMTEVIFEHDGTLDKFLGDALLAVFGAPLDQPDHALQAVLAALDMRRALAEMNRRSGAQPLEMRIAVNTGLAVTGDIGSPRRREFTVLGDTVNTASRIEDEATAPGQIVVAGPTWERVRHAIRATPLGSRVLRGRSTPLDLYAIDGAL